MDHKEGQRPRSTDIADTKNRPGGHAPEAAALVQPWLRLSEQLTPLIGESGFCALFGRALRLSSVSFEGLATCDSGRPLADLFTSLTRTLNEIGPEQAAAANGALLGTFTTLLGKLIGEALTKQLLNVASTGADGHKHGQEQK
jgi:hypothetical protein